MKNSRKPLNKYQKVAFKAGDHRTRQADIDRYLILAQSEDAADRLEAAKNLCPCHVRRRIDEVWQALYRMMEDPDTGVRRAAWHTLEDGGIPHDPAIESIFRRAVDRLADEPDRATRAFIEEFALPYLQQQEEIAIRRSALEISPYQQRGRCDFCARREQPVRTDFDTQISDRFALICQRCD